MAAGDIRISQSGARYVTVRLADETYGLPIESVESIVRWETLTRLPRMPKFIIGLLNLRGSAIPVMDLRTRLELPAQTSESENRIVIVHINGILIGMVVEAVRQVVWIENALIETNLPMVSSCHEEGKDSYLHGVANLADGFVILLDLSGLLDSKEFSALEKLESRAKAA